jgi:hypothetical protein
VYETRKELLEVAGTPVLATKTQTPTKQGGRGQGREGKEFVAYMPGASFLYKEDHAV